MAFDPDLVDRGPSPVCSLASSLCHCSLRLLPPVEMSAAPTRRACERM